MLFQFSSLSQLRKGLTEFDIDQKKSHSYSLRDIQYLRSDVKMKGWEDSSMTLSPGYDIAFAHKN